MTDATGWDERYRASPQLWSRGPNTFVAERLADAKPGVGLDLACGEGRNTVWLASLGWDMTGVDFSQVAIDRAQAADPTSTWVVADVAAWEPDDLFDLVLVAYLHLPSPVMRELLIRAADWLAPGGEVFLVGHDRSNLEEGYGGPQDPDVLWNVHEIVDLFTGMRVVEAGVADRPVESDGDIVFAKDALVRLRRPD